jgi:DNA polymerase I
MTIKEAQNLFDYLITKQILSLDTETTSTSAVDAELVGLSFAVKEKEAFYVAIPAEREEALKFVNIFKPLYENPEILKVGQNIKYDYEVLMNYGVEIQGKMFDTMIAHYLIQPELYHNMDYLAEVYLKYQTVHIEELIGPKGKNQKSMRDLSPTEVYEYAAEDADITLRLKNVLEPKLKEIECEDLFWNVEMPLVPVLAHMEMTGVCIDTDTLKETSNNLTNLLLSELIGILHFLYHDFLYLLFFLWINREVEFIVYLDDHLTLDALCLESVEDLHHGNLDDVGF